MSAHPTGRPARSAAKPRLRVTYTFDYRPVTYTGEDNSPEALARRDLEAFNYGDLTFEDVEDFQMGDFKVEPVDPHA